MSPLSLGVSPACFCIQVSSALKFHPNKALPIIPSVRCRRNKQLLYHPTVNTALHFPFPQPLCDAAYSFPLLFLKAYYKWYFIQLFSHIISSGLVEGKINIKEWNWFSWHMDWYQLLKILRISRKILICDIYGGEDYTMQFLSANLITASVVWRKWNSYGKLFGISD